MSSLQAFGDIHGRNNWKFLIDEQFDHIVFVGDYFDSPVHSAQEQIDNFLEIIEWKKRYPNKVHLMFGNHEYHYMRYTDDLYSGWQEDAEAEIQPLLEENMKYLQPSFTLGNIIFSHAGITRSFAKRTNLNVRHIDKSLQLLFDRDRSTLGLYNNSISGDSVEQSPIWVRPPYLLKDKLSGYYQVVGHTKQEMIQLQDGCAFIDVAGLPLEADNIERFDWEQPYSF